MADPTREIVHAFLDDDRRHVVMIERVDGERVRRRIRAEFVTWHRREDISKGMRQELRALAYFRGMRTEGSWLRCSWQGEDGRNHAKRCFKANGIDTFEGDVDPTLLYLAEGGLPIARPRRCYLDIETDSRVPLTRKEEMRILSWAVIDHETGEEHLGVLERETDEDEARLLTELARVLEAFDQICVWEGDWPGGEFDSVVVPARWRARGISVDERDWIWTNQLAVWKRRSSSESGEEKSFKLDVIANEQIGEGKEATPPFVIEHFGAEKCRRGLGAMAWDLWVEGGKFRALLLRYNARDARILRDLERKKHFVDLNLALARLAGLPPEDRSMEPVRMMDGYMLRLGRRLDKRHPTRERFDKDAMPAKFKGAIVFPPRSVPNEKPKDGEEPWSREQAAAWRLKHGFKNGILHGVHVCDFSGMYPSIMMTFNLGAEVTAGWEKDPTKLKPDTCMSPGTGLVTRTDEKALITFAFEEMAAQRKHWADLAGTLPPGTSEYLDAIAMSDAYKVAMNAFYGAGGTPFSRFYNRDVSEATTQTAKHFIMLAAREAEKRNMVVAYGDSLPPERTVVVRDPRGHVRIIPIGDLWLEVGAEFMSARGKDFALPNGWQALTDEGWCKLERVIRHRVAKPVHSISTKHGHVRVTADHSLMVGGEKVSPGDFVAKAMTFDVVPAPRETPSKVIDILDHVDRFVYKRWDAKCKHERVVRFVAAPDGEHVMLAGAQVHGEVVLIRRFYREGTKEWCALLRLVGAYVSDGSVSLKGVTTTRCMLSFCKADLPTQKQVAEDLRCIATAFIRDPFWTETVFVVRSGTIAMSVFFAALCGMGCIGKRLPSFAFALGRKGYEVLRQSLLDGDGSTDASGAFIFTSTSQQLTAGVSYVLSQNAEPHSFSFREGKGAWTIRTRKGIERKTRYAIKHIVDVDYEGDVFDLTVEGAHTFVDGIGRVLLHNTDALCVVGPSSRGFAKFVDWLNTVRFPEEVAKFHAPTNRIKLAYEKSYERVVYVTKKRYSSTYAHYKFSTTCNRCTKKSGDPGSVDVRTLTCRDCGHVYDAIPRFLGKPEIKGIAFRRGDVTKLARDFQARVIDMLVGGVKQKGDDGKEHPVNPGMETPTEDLLSYRRVIEEVRDRVLVGALSVEEIVERKGLSKSLREYSKKEVEGKEANEVHVRVAKMLLERGENVSRGMQIEYVVVDGSVSPQRAVPAADYVGECDRYYLWEKVWSPTKQLLEAAFPDEDWEQWDAERPKRKSAGKGGKKAAPEEQLGLALAARTRMSDADEIAVPAYRAQSLRVAIPEAAGKEAIDRVLAVLKRHPGARTVDVVIKLASGIEALIKTPIRVSPGPRLKTAIDEAIAIGSTA